MKIALIGYGKMNQAVEKAALDKKYQIISKITSSKAQLEEIKKADLAIEFTHPKCAFSNIKFCLENNIQILSGTTGWLDRFDEIKSLCKEKNGSFFYAPNFSVGVNLFFEASKLVFNLMHHYKEYKIEIEETHHKEKKDIPSGTALFLREMLKSKLDLQNFSNEIPIKSNRIKNEVGTHHLIFSNDLEEIQISHRAFDRSVFARGVLQVSDWFLGKKGVFSMKDFLNNS